ncbi:hypothetical protein CPC08DRAFT_812654 [Agrocybe pediades]|nr:hypothetical protein CPC08DRAFT_812654 [Agrocybe pediades]
MNVPDAEQPFNSRAPSPIHALPPNPPSPPPKTAFSSSSPIFSSQTLVLPPADSLSSISSPSTPVTPTTPSVSADSKAKRSSPLTDLVDTEKAFVDQLTGIIRKVAAAWSRSNLPPPELDSMFRSIEGIYKANRGLHAKLKAISADPKSAGELGGLLIKWIDELAKPYETYCTKYCTGFDTWEPVQSNARLGPILLQFSSSNPAPSNAGTWTLDALFLLPKTRLKYYLKLYNRLLKNKDNRSLVEAVETLNRLMDTVEARASVKVGEKKHESLKAPTLQTEDEVVIDMRSQTSSPPTAEFASLRLLDVEAKTGSETSSNHGSVSGGERSSRESGATSMSRASTQTLSMPISDLERRLSTERTLDIFSMTPKAVKLQMSPPSLTFTREIRTSLDVVVRFTPRATGVEVVHRQGHLYLLSDLFLICERISPEDRVNSNEADMWLCYPPLSGKVLRVSDVNGQENALQVAIMRKEFIIIETDSLETRNQLMTHLKECIEFSGTLPPPSKQPPPPLPSFNTLPRMQPDIARNGSPVGTPAIDRTRENASPVATRSLLPAIQGQQNASSSESLPPAYATSEGRPPQVDNRRPRTSDGPHKPEPHLPPAPGPHHLRPSVSAQPLPRGPSFGPNNVLPSARSTSYVPGTNGNVTAGPSFSSPYGGQPFPGNPPPQQQQQAMFPNNPTRMQNAPYSSGSLPPSRPPSEPFNDPRNIHKAPSIRSLGSQYSQHDIPGHAPPLPPFHPGYPNNGGPIPRNNSFGSGLQPPQARPLLPSAQQRAVSMAMAEIPFNEPSPPNSPVQQPQQLGPVVSTISAQMKCKVFLQQHHAQWKSLGSAKLKLYREEPTNVKQLVVEADDKNKSVLISTIVLTDGVERVGKTGVAIELSDKGARTGIVYMIQLRNENSAGGLFDSLLAGSDRAR